MFQPRAEHRHHALGQRHRPAARVDQAGESRKLCQRQRVAGGCGQNRRPGPGRQGHPGAFEQVLGILGLQRGQRDLTPPCAGEHRRMRHPLAGQNSYPGMGQPTPHGADHLPADAVQPVHVIDDQQHRLYLCRGLQEFQNRPHHRQHRDHRVRFAAERRGQHRPVLFEQPGGEILQSQHQLVQPAQREGLLCCHPQDPHHLPAVRRRARTHLLDQRRLAHTGFAGHDHGPFGVLGQKPRQLGRLDPPADQGRWMGGHGISIHCSRARELSNFTESNRGT